MELTPSHSYGVSLAVWDHKCYLSPDTSERTPPSGCVHPSQTGWYSIYRLCEFSRDSLNDCGSVSTKRYNPWKLTKNRHLWHVLYRVEWLNESYRPKTYYPLCCSIIITSYSNLTQMLAHFCCFGAKRPLVEKNHNVALVGFMRIVLYLWSQLIKTIRDLYSAMYRKEIRGA